MKIAIIPARGGSTRIPRKNIKDFRGKPMIAWSIGSAIESGLFDHVIVSTDDSEIAEVAKQYGADIPFMRPKDLSDNYTPTRPVVNHAINAIQSIYGTPQYVCCIYATAPFVRSSDLQAGYEKLLHEDCDFAFSVTSFPFPIQRALRITSNGRVDMINPEHRFTRSQDLEETYHDAGQFYWGKTDSFIKDKPTFSQVSVPVILPRCRVQDIDTQEDWEMAEAMHKTLESLGV